MDRLGRPLRILYITEIFPDPKTGKGYWGGGERQFYEVARRMAQMGHSVKVLTCRFPGQAERDLLEGMEVHRTGLSRSPTGNALKSPVSVASYLARTAKEALSLEADVIHCNAYYPVFAGRLAAAAKGVPMISTFHDLPDRAVWEDHTSSALWGLAGYLVTVASLCAAGGRVITVSSQAMAKLRARGKTAVVIPNGVDLRALEPGGAPRNEGQVLYVGRLVNYKRVDSLIRAFGQVVAENGDATLVIAGDGGERAGLEALAAKLGVAAAIRFTGTIPTDEVAELYKQSSIFVLPSLVEGEGLVLKEAMAAGVPVVAMDSAQTGVASVVEDGVNGFLVKPGDDRLLSNAITRLLADAALRKRLGASGEAAAREWDWDEVAGRTLEVYRLALLSGRSGTQSDAPIPKDLSRIARTRLEVKWPSTSSRPRRRGKQPTSRSLPSNPGSTGEVLTD